MDKIDKVLNTDQYPIYAGVSNLEEIKYRDIKQGWFVHVLTEMKGEEIKDWPLVDFYYASDVSIVESENLLNIDDWPIIHASVMEEFKKKHIEGIQYLPIRLVDTVTHKVNHNYYVMNILNWIDPIDMKKSEYEYDEEYNFYSFLPPKTYFLEEKCKEYDIFKCTKMPIGIYVSDKIKKIFDDNNWDWFLLRKQKMVKAKEKGAIDLER
ncbi:MAG: hypothetical protein RR741_05220 [Erysipelotrichaceae bacterium]